MTICSGGDRRLFGVQTGRWQTRDADSLGAQSASRPARPARQHPLQPTERFERAKPASPPNVPAGSGVACWRAKGRGGGQQAFSRSREPLSKSTIRHGLQRRQALGKHPGSRDFRSIVRADPALCAPAGGTTRRRAPEYQLVRSGQRTERLHPDCYSLRLSSLPNRSCRIACRAH